MSNKRCVDNNIFMKADDNFQMDINVEQGYPTASAHMSHMEMNSQMMGMGGCQMQPVYECPQERVCHRVINHECPHL